MKLSLQLLVYNILLTVTVMANDPFTESPISMDALKSTNISPEIIKELKDFEHLIPTATIDEIVAKHYLVDGNFRTALKYLRSNEFTQLQRQLLTMPEILNVLDFLHLTTVNATTMHMAAAAATASASASALERASLDDYTDNELHKMTTNTASTSNTVVTTSTQQQQQQQQQQQATTKTLSKRPQLHMKFNDNDIDVNGEVARTFIEQPPQLRFVLLDDSKVKTNAYDAVVPVAVAGRHNDKHISPASSAHSLGTFTSFVEEILQHLPNTAYQNMIKDKCQKNAKFAEFYKALRSPEFKPIVEEAMKTPNILKIINHLNSDDIDVKSLEPIAFQVISWGPKI